MQTVIGLFENAHEAQQAAQQLMSSGFSQDNVDLSIRGNSTQTSGSFSTGSTASDGVTGMDSTMTTGAGSRDNIASGNLDRSTNYNNDNDDSFGDKVSRFFKNLFGDDDDDQVNRYSHVAGKTGCIVTVYAQSRDEAERAADILDDNGAIDVDKRADEYGYTSGNSGSSYSSIGSDTGDSTYATGADSLTGSSDSNYTGRLSDDDTDETNKLNVIREDIQVGKREVQTGGVRLRSRIVERPVEEQVRLREETVTIERTPVDRPATTADFQNFKEGEIEMTEYAEVADVTKEARVVEEIKVSKDVNERTETVRETARDTEVDIENINSTDARRTGSGSVDL